MTFARLFFRVICGGCDVLGAHENRLAESELLEAANSGDFDEVRKQLEQGANVNCTNSLGSSPLLLATITGNFKVVEFLLGKGAHPNQTGPDYWTPLHAACYFGHASVVCLLLSKGGDIDAKTIKGKLPGAEFDPTVPAAVRITLKKLLEYGQGQIRKDTTWTALSELSSNQLQELVAALEIPSESKIAHVEQPENRTLSKKNSTNSNLGLLQDSQLKIPSPSCEASVQTLIEKVQIEALQEKNNSSDSSSDLKTITTQPVEGAAYLVEAIKYSRTTCSKQWKDGLFECCNNCVPSCCMSYWCPCVITGQMRQKMNVGACKSTILGGFLCGFPMSTAHACQLRGVIRERDLIPGSNCEDCLVVYFCTFCAISQMARHVYDYKPQHNDCLWTPTGEKATQIANGQSAVRVFHVPKHPTSVLSTASEV